MRQINAAGMVIAASPTLAAEVTVELSGRQTLIRGRRLANRGAALWANLVISDANWPARSVATDKDAGRVAPQPNATDGQLRLAITAVTLVINDRGRQVLQPAPVPPVDFCRDGGI